MEITVHGKNLKVTADLRGDTYALLTAIPGRKKWEGRVLFANPSSANVEFLTETFPDAVWDAAAQEIRDAYSKKSAEAAENSAAKREGINLLSLTDDFVYKTEPRIHQRRVFLLSRDKVVWGLLDEQGCGKTKVALDSAAYLFRKSQIDALVVVAPNGVHRNWVDNEIPAHLPLGPKEYIARFYSSSLSEKKFKELAEELTKWPKDKLLIAAFNVDGFTSERAQDFIQFLVKSRRTMMVVDESHWIKGSKAKRTRFLWKVGSHALYRRIMSGTPIEKGPEDYYAQFRFLDPNIIGHDTLTGFRNEFCIMGGFERKQVVGFKNVEKLIKKVDGYSSRNLKKDCLDLPEKVYKRYPFELTPAQRKLYDELNREFFTMLGGRELTADLAVTRLMRLQQITCNWFPGDDDKGRLTPISDRNPRLEALLENLEVASGKVIIWSKFRADLMMLRERLGAKAVAYYGGISDDMRAEAVDRFQNDKRIQWFIGNPSTAGTGLTLTAASEEIFYSNDYSLLKRLQAEDRAHRIGMQDHLTITDLEAIKTNDRKIITSLQKKKSIADIINQDPKSFFMESQ
jgi:SNF2 family DNA or RNA helicase